MNELIESYINGNKDYVFKQYEKMNPSDKEQFLKILRFDYGSDIALDIYRSLLIRLI